MKITLDTMIAEATKAEVKELDTLIMGREDHFDDTPFGCFMSQPNMAINSTVEEMRSYIKGEWQKRKAFVAPKSSGCTNFSDFFSAPIELV